jgi:hypothetical protein
MVGKGPNRKAGPVHWPNLYRVTLRGLKGEERVDVALSWLDEYKAVAMAVEAHAGGWIGPKKTWFVYSVEVEALGPAPKTKDGLVEIGPDVTLHDRSEF